MLFRSAPSPTTRRRDHNVAEKLYLWLYVNHVFLVLRTCYFRGWQPSHANMNEFNRSTRELSGSTSTIIRSEFLIGYSLIIVFFFFFLYRCIIRAIGYRIFVIIYILCFNMLYSFSFIYWFNLCITFYLIYTYTYTNLQV